MSEKNLEKNVVNEVKNIKLNVRASSSNYSDFWNCDIIGVTPLNEKGLIPSLLTYDNDSLNDLRVCKVHFTRNQRFGQFIYKAVVSIKDTFTEEFSNQTKSTYPLDEINYDLIANIRKVNPSNYNDFTLKARYRLSVGVSKDDTPFMMLEVIAGRYDQDKLIILSKVISSRRRVLFKIHPEWFKTDVGLIIYNRGELKEEIETFDDSLI